MLRVEEQRKIIGRHNSARKVVPVMNKSVTFWHVQLKHSKNQLILKLVEINGYLKSYSERLIQKTFDQRVSDAQRIYLLQKRFVNTPKMRKVQTNFIHFMGGSVEKIPFFTFSPLILIHIYIL